MEVESHVAYVSHPKETAKLIEAGFATSAPAHQTASAELTLSRSIVGLRRCRQDRRRPR